MASLRGFHLSEVQPWPSNRPRRGGLGKGTKRRPGRAEEPDALETRPLEERRLGSRGAPADLLVARWVGSLTWSPSLPARERPGGLARGGAVHHPAGSREHGTFSPGKSSIPNMVKRHRWAASSSPTLRRERHSAPGGLRDSRPGRAGASPRPRPWAGSLLRPRPAALRPGSVPGAQERQCPRTPGLSEGKGHFH